MNLQRRRLSISMIAGLACGSLAAAQDTPEIEPNETKAQATVVLAPMAAGHTLSGTTTGTSTTVAGAASADTFRVKTVTDVLAIYRYRLALTTTGTAGHVGTIRGLGQVAAAQSPWPGPLGTANATDTTIQTSATTTTPARFVQWYGFGKGEELFYRVTGTATTTAPYAATLDRTTITPTTIGSFAPGIITLRTLGQGHTTDTELWVYDSNLDVIPGYSNDDEAITAVSGVTGATGTTLQSVLRRTYTPGTYYVAVSTFATQTHLGSPCDDDFRTGALMDFAGSITNNSTATTGSMQFTIADSVNPAVVVPNTHAGAFDVNWFRFTVTGGCYADCDGIGGLTANDFQCFLNAFAANQSYANCDTVGGLTANDFQCFLNAYAAGCS